MLAVGNAEKAMLPTDALRHRVAWQRKPEPLGCCGVDTHLLALHSDGPRKRGFFSP